VRVTISGEVASLAHRIQWGAPSGIAPVVRRPAAELVSADVAAATMRPP